MAVNLLITDRKHYSKIKNGADYLLNPLDIFTHLKGNVLERQKIVYTLELYWEDEASASNEWFTESGNILRRTSGSWITEGFSIGDTIDYWDVTTASFWFQNRLITNISDTIIVFDGVALADQVEDTAILYGGKTDVNGLEYSFGIVPQDASPKYRSLLDSSDQTLYHDNIQAGSVAGTPKGSLRSWVTGTSSAEFLSRPSTYVQEFKVTHEFLINPFWQEGEESNFEDGLTPELLLGNNTLKYVSKFDFRTNLSNPNTSKIHEDDIQLGSIGWFDESFNGYNSNHVISALTYTDVATASASNGLNISSATSVSFTVTSANPIFTVGSPVIAYHSYLPDFNTYAEKSDLFEDIWFNEDLYNTVNGGITNGTLIKFFTANRVTDYEINITFQIIYTATQREVLEEGNNYLLGLGVSDPTLENNDDLDKTILLVDFDQYLKENNIPDLLFTDVYGFKQYNYFLAPLVDLTTDLKGWVEDGNLFHHRFGIDRTALKDTKIIALRFKLVAYNSVTNDFFDLQSEEIDLSNVIDLPINTHNANPFEIQYLDIQNERGYTLADGDEFNFLRVETVDSDATYQYYESTIGFKMNWQEWIKLDGADDVFFIQGDPSNGLNNLASNYNLLNDYGLRVIMQADLTGLDEFLAVGETTYNEITPEFDIYDFGGQDDTPASWSCEIKTFDEFGVELDADNLGTSEVTEIHGVFTLLTNPNVGDILDYWGVLRIQEEGQLGFNVDVIATNKIPNSNIRLEPLDGLIYCDIAKTSLNVITIKANTNPSNLKDGIGYLLSAELKNFQTPLVLNEWNFNTKINIPIDGTFDPVLTAGGGEVPTWYLIDTYVETGKFLNIGARTGLPGSPSSLAATELVGVCQQVKITFSTNDPTNVSTLIFNDDFICEDIDFTLLTGVKTFNFLNNNITSITFPVSATILDELNFKNNDISGVLDLTNLSNLALLLKFQENAITSLVLPTTSTAITTFTFQTNAGLTGALDLSVLSQLGGRIDFTNCALTSIIFPAASTTLTSVINFSNNSLAGAFDISGLTLTNNLEMNLNSNSLTSIVFPSNSVTVKQISCKTNTTLTTVDFTNMQQLSGIILFTGSGLTSLTFPVASTTAITKLDFSGNSLGITVDMSGLGALGGELLFFNNTITGFTMPAASTETLEKWDSSNNNHGYVDFTVFAAIDETSLLIDLGTNVLSVANVDQVLIDLDGILTGGTGNIILNNQTPAAPPTLGAANLNVISLQGKGYTVTTD